MAFRLRSGSVIRQLSSSRQDLQASRTSGFLARAGLVCLAAASALSSGCMTSNDELFFWGDEREITYYKDQSTKIDYPDVGQESPQEVTTTDEPRRIGHPRKDDIADLKLDDALKTALLNAEVIRDNAQFLNSGNRLLTNPDFTSSIHDIAIQETNLLFGQGGVQAALSEFDATFTTSLMTGVTETPVDTTTTGFDPKGITGPRGRHQDFGDFRSRLSKIFADGSQFTLQHNWLYTQDNTNNTSVRPFFSQYTSRANASQDEGLPTFGAEFRTPLLQGAGTRYTRIAGPIAKRPTLQSTPLVNQGVVIARIRTDISLADFEGSVQQLIRDTEDTYWELYLAYRTYDAESVATRSALQTWREVRANKDVGKIGAADEAQAQDNYFETRARRENALAGLYQTEVRLRRLMGLPVNDQTVLRPIDDPITAQISSDWNVSLTEALTYRPELRRQKWNIKSLELQHEAAGMLVRPRLDFVARYEANGYGDQLTGDDPTPFHSAYGSLWSGDFQGWGLGFEFSMPIGFRAATTQVQNLEHRIAKARSLLAEQEKEISYEMAATFQQVAQAYQSAKTNFNRRRAAARRVAAFEAEYRVGRTTVDLLLRAQISFAQAEIAYFSSLVSYNRALNDLNFRKGTILYDRNVYLTESLWTEEAYEDAMRRAWERSFAFDAPFLDAEPDEFVLECPECEMTDEWNGEITPMPLPQSAPSAPPEENIEAVPTPTDPSKPDSTRPDNKTAILPLEPETGGLQYDETVPPASNSQLLPDEPVTLPATVPAPKDVPASEAAAATALPIEPLAPAGQTTSQPAFVPEIIARPETSQPASPTTADLNFEAPIQLDQFDTPVPQDDAFLQPINPDLPRSALLNSAQSRIPSGQSANRPASGSSQRATRGRSIQQTGEAAGQPSRVRQADFQQPVGRSAPQSSPGPIFGWDKLFNR
ncbi:TolC family protein [bacterium]|nr:TolC family protein [bacterium]